MKHNKANIVIIIVFIATITLPQIVFWLINNDNTKNQISTAENRFLSEKPDLKISTITTYPEEYDAYYNDHLPFRTELRNLWTKVNSKLFNLTVDDRVLIGKDGWLFYRIENSIADAQGVLDFTDGFKNHIIEKLNQTNEHLKEKNIEFYVLMLPNKENIYREYLPDTVPIKSEVSRAEKLIEDIRNSGINIVYPKNELLGAKEKYQVYRKCDTHYNSVGALIASIELQKAIDPSFSYDIDNIKVIHSGKMGGDLTNYASLGNEWFEDNLVVEGFLPEIEYTNEKNGKCDEYTSNSSNNKTLLFVGDSFSSATKQFLCKLYKKSVFVRRDDYNKKILEDVKPDIVVMEAVERYIEQIQKDLFN